MTANQPTACRSCGYTELQDVLSLGRSPLANALLKEEQLAQPEEQLVSQQSRQCRAKMQLPRIVSFSDARRGWQQFDGGQVRG